MNPRLRRRLTRILDIYGEIVKTTVDKTAAAVLTATVMFEDVVDSALARIDAQLEDGDRATEAWLNDALDDSGLEESP